LDFPSELPYNQPFFEELDLDELGKVRFPGTTSTRMDTLLIGLSPVISEAGHLTHLAISNRPEVIEIHNWEDIVTALCDEDGKYIAHLAYDEELLEAIIKHLPYEILEELAEKRSSYFNGTQIWYSPNHKVTLLNTKGEAKIQILRNWSKRLTFYQACKRAQVTYDANNHLSIAQATRSLGKEIQKRLEIFLNHKVQDLSTPGILTREVFARDTRTVDVTKIPVEALKLAYECLHAPWIEMMAQGYFKDTYDYDIDSAYPNEVAKLIACDSRVGEWVHRDEYVEGAEYGFCRALITVVPALGGVSPIRFRKPTGRLFSPFGSWVGFITKDEIDYIDRSKLGKVDIIEGWWFVPRLRVHPFLRSVNRLLEMRDASKKNDPVLAAIMKSISVRVNGHFLQKYQTLDTIISPVTGREIPEFVAGPLFNPVYACTVMTRTKIKLAEISRIVQARKGQVLAVTVDGLVSSVSIGREAGRKLVTRSPAVIASPLIMHLENRSTTTNILAKLWKHPESRTYQLGQRRRITLPEAARANRYDLVGQYEMAPATLTVGSDISRIWMDIPFRGKELLDRSYYSKQPGIEYVMMGDRNGG